MTQVIDRQEVQKYLDREVEWNTKQYGPDSYWTKQAVENREQVLKEYDEGKPVHYKTEYDHKGYGTWGEDIRIEFYSDGTQKKYSYAAD